MRGREDGQRGLPLWRRVRGALLPEGETREEITIGHVPRMDAVCYLGAANGL